MQTRRIHIAAILFALLILSLCSTSGAQTAAELEEQISQAKTRLNELKLESADLLAEEAFSEAEGHIRNAQKLLDKGNLFEAKEAIGAAEKAMQDAQWTTERFQEVFKDVIEARADCEPVQAALGHSPKAWVLAEGLFRDAIDALTKDNHPNAMQYADEAEVLFREAELYAIQMVITQDARIMIDQAEKLGAEKYSPRNLQLAYQFVDKTFELLEEDRYNRVLGNKIAAKALYHATYANRISQWAREYRKKKDAFELTWLQADSAMSAIGQVISYKPAFEKGLEPPTEGIIATIRGLFGDNLALQARIDSLQTENDSLALALAQANEELARWRNEYGALASEYETEMEKKRLEEEIRREQEARLRRLRELLNEHEADILIDGSDIILRLIGLQFASGSSDIPPESYDLLRRVIIALEEFPDNKVRVEGHTDAQGDTRANQQLSERRALSVFEYLLANSKKLKPGYVNYVGHGEDRPIATNETKDGRSKNRRLEVIMLNVVRSVSSN